MNSSPSRIGHLVMTGVFVGVAVLMFAPSLLVTWDNRSLDVGDKVDADNAIFRGNIMSIEDGNAVVRSIHGTEKTFPVSDLTEL